MTFPALSKNYCTRANVPITDTSTVFTVAKNLVWLFKEALKDTLTTGTFTGTRHANSVWTVVGSSDGVTAALDGVDRWGTTFDPAKIVGAGSSVAHSWIILQNTTLGVQLLIDHNYAASEYFRVAMSPTHTPYALNGTNPRYSPPITTYSVRCNASADGVSSGYFFAYNVTAATHYLSVTFTDDGQFYAMTHRSGALVFLGSISIVKLEDTNANDLGRAFFFGAVGGGVRGWPASYNGETCMSNSPTGANSNTWGGEGMLAFGSTPHINSSFMGPDYFTEVCRYSPLRVIHRVDPMVYRGYVPDVYEVLHGGIGVSIPSVSAQTHIIASFYAIPFIGAQPIL